VFLLFGGIMHSLTRKVLLLVVLVLCVSSSFAAQKKKQHEPSEAERPASASRSFMELFTKLERNWADAAQKKDQAELEQFLAPEFIVRTSADPDHPVSRAEWMQNVLTRYDIRSVSQRSMAIRAFLGSAVVSFVQTQQASVGGKDRSGDFFIVDLWVTNNGKWQAAARFISAVEKQPVPAQKKR
jgi:Domain of unknown function (DUF4440)